MTETNTEFYTICVSKRETYGIEYNDFGNYYGDNKEGRPLFRGLDNVLGCNVVHFQTLSEAKATQERISKYFKSEIEFNEEFWISIYRNYLEDGEWYSDVLDEEEIIVSYQFKDITGYVVVRWSWETHVGYCRKFEDVFTVSKYDECHDDSMLTPINLCHQTQCSVIFTAEEVEKITNNGTYAARLEETLKENRWCWCNPDYIDWFLHHD